MVLKHQMTKFSFGPGRKFSANDGTAYGVQKLHLRVNIVLRFCVKYRLHSQFCSFFSSISSFYMLLSVWFVRLYGKIIHELQRVDYRPYRSTDYTLNSLLHNSFALCALGDIWC